LSVALLASSIAWSLSAQTVSVQSLSAQAQVPPRPGVVGQREE